MNKISKREYFTSLCNLATSGELYFTDAEGARTDVTAEQLLEFAQNEIGLIDRKNEKAKERAEKKRMEGDELSAAVFAALTDEFSTIADIAARVDAEDVSVAKTQFRLNQMAKQDKIEKGSITIPATEGSKARTVVAYRKI